MKCTVCGSTENQCKTVAQAANCLSRKAKIFIFVLICALIVLATSCKKPNAPEKFTDLTEAQAVKIVISGAERGNEYIVTKKGDGDNARYDVVQVNVKK